MNNGRHRVEHGAMSNAKDYNQLYDVSNNTKADTNNREKETDMKTLIYTFLALFIWVSIPIDAMASRGDRNDRRSTTYRESTNHDRHGERHEVRKHRKHNRQTHYRRAQHWRPAPRVKYVYYPEYRSYDVPSGYVYSATPGVTLYFSW